MAGGIDNPSVLVGSKVVFFCVQVHVKRRDTFLYFCESYWRQTLVSSPREIVATLHLKPSTWGNQRGARSHQANFWRRCRGLKELQKTGPDNRQFLALLPGTPIYKIGELHTIFYLCFLVFLLYLSVFTFVSLIKNTKNTCYYYGFQ